MRRFLYLCAETLTVYVLLVLFAAFVIWLRGFDLNGQLAFAFIVVLAMPVSLKLVSGGGRRRANSARAFRPLALLFGRAAPT